VIRESKGGFAMENDPLCGGARWHESGTGGLPCHSFKHCHCRREILWLASLSGTQGESSSGPFSARWLARSSEFCASTTAVPGALSMSFGIAHEELLTPLSVRVLTQSAAHLHGC